MTDLTPEIRLKTLAQAGWSDVCDRLLAGVCHDLNGRVTSLMGMMQLLQLDEDASSVAPFLDQEVQRLEACVRMLRELAGEPEEEEEPIHLPEILPSLIRLAGRHRYLERIEPRLEIGDGLLPIRGRWTLAGRAVLLQCSIAAREAMARSRQLVIHVEPVGPKGVARIRAVVPGERGEVELPPVAGRPEGMSAVAALIGASWSIRSGDDEATFDITIPMMGGR